MIFPMQSVSKPFQVKLKEQHTEHREKPLTQCQPAEDDHKDPGLAKLLTQAK